MKSSKVQNGGVKLKNAEKRGFTPVFDMLQSPNVVITILTYKSLKGFMFTLNIPPDETEYIARGTTSNRFDEPVTSFIMKVVITSQAVEVLPPYMNRVKTTETKESFLEEANLQQHIWLKSIKGRRPEICPSVANLALFNNVETNKFLNFLLSKTQGEAQDVVQYLISTVLNQNLDVGVMLMPNITESLTLYDFLNMKGQYVYGIPVDNRRIELAYAYLISQVCRLYVDIGVIHFDLHSQNSLIRIHEGEITALIIDFGRASNIMNNVEDTYLTVDQKRNLRLSRKDSYNKLFDLPYPTENNFQDQVSYVEGLMLFLKLLDRNINRNVLHNYSGYQMRWLERVLNDPNSTSIFIKAFTNLKKNTETNIVQTFKTLKRKGYIENFNDVSVDDVTVPFNESIPITTNKLMNTASENSVFIGGKRTIKLRSRRKRQSKKEREKSKNRKQDNKRRNTKSRKRR